jgi:hypothetical protein
MWKHARLITWRSEVRILPLAPMKISFVDSKYLKDGISKAPRDPEMVKLTEIILKGAGCKCGKPLIGYRPGTGPRCRQCNTVAKTEFECE